MSQDTHPQYAKAPDGTEMVLLSREQYEKLLEAASQKDRGSSLDGEPAQPFFGARIPLEVERSVAAGVHPIIAWRKHRRMSQGKLAEIAGPLTEAGSLTQAAIARLEATVPGAGRPDTLAAIATALDAPAWAIAIVPKSAMDKLRHSISRSAGPRTGRLVRPA